MHSDRVPDTRPQAPAPMLMPVVMFVIVPVVMPVIVFVIVFVIAAGRVLLVPHLPRMTRKAPCSTSTPAILARLQKPRRPKPLQRA
jgi:hypothetical protein